MLLSKLKAVSRPVDQVKVRYLLSNRDLDMKGSAAV